ncbi:MAG: adenosine deaminase [Pseudomonadales bacterium]
MLHRLIVRPLVVLGLCLSASLAWAGDWFETFKDSATDQQLLRFLTAMPKGGDLHNHITGAVFPEWFFELAVNAEKDGYRYYTKIKINNCRYGNDEYGGDPYLLMFRNINQLELDALSDCERGEYVPVADLTGAVKQEWLDSLRLDEPHEGRDEFFEAHWARMGSMALNPHLVADLLVMNMQAFGAEGLLYLEAQIMVHGFTTPDGKAIAPDAVADIYRARLKEQDAQDSGVTVRFQIAILRFTPNAEQFLEVVYRFVAANDDFVGINMVGREDNDKGYPLRFLQTLRKMRSEVGDVPLAFHAGEVDEPNAHIRDTLLLGADRIGHGVNLISDPDTLLMMRHGPYLVEVNLISNLLLEYISDYSQHPFPEYLRIDVPVALSTDDRGMWDSTLTDEFFVAVKEFDLSWAEIRKLSNNSVAFGFLAEVDKARLLQTLNQRLDQFEKAFASNGMGAFKTTRPQYRGFLCRQYKVCDPAASQ